MTPGNNSPAELFTTETGQARPHAQPAAPPREPTGVSPRSSVRARLAVGAVTVMAAGSIMGLGVAGASVSPLQTTAAASITAPTAASVTSPGEPTPDELTVGADEIAESAFEGRYGAEIRTITEQMLTDSHQPRLGA